MDCKPVGTHRIRGDLSSSHRVQRQQKHMDASSLHPQIRIRVPPTMYAKMALHQLAGPGMIGNWLATIAGSRNDPKSVEI